MNSMDRSVGDARTGGRSQSEVVVDGIKAMITSGLLAPGARLPVEKDLAAQLGVSRGSLREGVRALALAGILETRQGDGTYVTALEPGMMLSPISFLVELHRPENLADLQVVRRILEVEATARAALRITPEELGEARRLVSRMDELLHAPGPRDHDAVMDADIAFHQVIAGASRNTTLEALIDALASRTVRARMWRAINDEGAEFNTHQEHRAILTALEAGDPDAARVRMSVHLLGVEQYSTEHEGSGAGLDHAAGIGDR